MTTINAQINPSTKIVAKTVTLHDVSAESVGLGNVDNTSDLNKPVSTAQQSALDLKADQATTYTKTEVDTNIANLVDTAPATLDTLNELAAALGDDANFSTTVTNSIATKASQTDLDTHIGDANNPHGVTATQVGLSNVTNESKATMFTDPSFSDRIRIAYEAPSTNEWRLQAETQARFSIIESFSSEAYRTFVVDRFSNVEINTLTLAKNNRYETRSSPSYTTVREFQKSLISDDGVVPTSSAVQKYIAETSPVTAITGTGGETHSRYKSGWLKSEITAIDTSFGTSDIETVKFGSEVDSIVNTIFKARAGLKLVDFGLIPMVNFEACRNCPDLERVIMRTSNQIGQAAFFDCTSLSDVDLGSVTDIGFSAFKNCTALASLTIPASVTVLGNTVFDGCSSLSEVNCYADESVFDPAGGNVFRGTASPLVIHAKIESDWVEGTGRNFQGNANVTVIKDLV